MNDTKWAEGIIQNLSTDHSLLLEAIGDRLRSLSNALRAAAKQRCVRIPDVVITAVDDGINVEVRPVSGRLEGMETVSYRVQAAGIVARVFRVHDASGRAILDGSAGSEVFITPVTDVDHAAAILRSRIEEVVGHGA